LNSLSLNLKHKKFSHNEISTDHICLLYHFSLLFLEILATLLFDSNKMVENTATPSSFEIFHRRITFPTIYFEKKTEKRRFHEA